MDEVYALLGEILTHLDPFMDLRMFFTWHEDHRTLVVNGQAVHPVQHTPAQYRV